MKIEETTTRVLIVDDNELYRTAFRRNLMLQNYDVIEAENADEAVELYEKEKPDIVVTDLSMRTPTEGLELIRSIKSLDPLIPIVLISAVGTFEEGSIAKELGADRVLMKQKIDEHIEELYTAIEQAKANGEKMRTLRQEIATISNSGEEKAVKGAARLREIIATPRQNPVILAEAYDALMYSTEREVRLSLEQEMKSADDQMMKDVDKSLAQLIPDFDKCDPETSKELRTAEYFFTRQGGDQPGQRGDFSRNIGFSYCFAVENEAKARLRKKLTKFLSETSNFKLIRSLIDSRNGQLDLFYHQHLLRLQQSYVFDFTVENVRQVFQRILEHESRYKPDGLKALGIMIVCFGREYIIKTVKGQVKIANPMGLRSSAKDEDVLRFAHFLVSLQHYRNPYIHPEISEMEKISKIRATALECLRQISRIL